MSRLLLATGRWFAQKTLGTQIVSLVFGAVLLCTALVGTLSFRARMQQVQDEALEQATALTGMVSRATASGMLERDYGALELFLGGLMTLPGVQMAELVHPGGDVAMRTQRTAAGHTTIFPSTETVAPPALSQHAEGLQIHTVSALVQGGGSAPQWLDPQALLRSGWVRIETNSQQRRADAMRQWTIDSVNVLLMLLGLLWLLALFLRRVFGPIGALAAFASTLADRPGGLVAMRWGSREVRELGHALNGASRQLAQMITDQEQRYKRLIAILDTAADAIVGVDEQGRIVNVNPAAERMFGLGASDLVSHPLARWLPDMDAAQLQQHMADGMLFQSTQSRVGRVEMKALRQDGTQFPVEVLLGEVMGDPELRYTCIVRDLTDFKLAEEYLTLYGRVLDCIPNGISVSDARRFPQPIVHINPAFTRITGYAPHEVLGRDASLLEGPETAREDLDLLARSVQRGNELKITLRNHRKDGSLFHNKLSVSPVFDGEGTITHYINVIEDVSGQIEVKQRLIERTARLNATFDLSPDGFAIFDAQGHLITSNPALRRMIGGALPLLTLEQFDDGMRSLCEDADRYQPIALAPNDGAKHTLMLVRPARKVLERDIRRHLGGSGETFVYFRDVTHQFEVDQMKSEFLATAAHELRTPLASILGFTELLLHRRYSEEKQKDLLQTVHRQGNLLQKLIQELLDLSRIEARQGKDFHIVPTPLAAIVEASVNGLTHQELGHEVHVQPLPDLMVMADASKIEQALNNLISNAIKYSPNGGEVRLAVREAMHNGQHCVVIDVQDQGIGMTPEQLARAFERFYRADTSGNIPGTGLGLNLVKEIAEIHGGWVALSSAPGEGTTASLWLRLATVPAAAAANADVTPA